MAAKEHHIRMFIVEGHIQYIHHKPSDPNNDKPGNRVSGPSKDKVKWEGTSDFTIEFKSGEGSPFTHNEGQFGSPITSTARKTKLFVLKDLSAGTVQGFKYKAIMGGITDDPEIIIDDGGGGGRSGRKKKSVKKKKKKKKK